MATRVSGVEMLDIGNPDTKAGGCDKTEFEFEVDWRISVVRSGGSVDSVEGIPGWIAGTGRVGEGPA